MRTPREARDEVAPRCGWVNDAHRPRSAGWAHQYRRGSGWVKRLHPGRLRTLGPYVNEGDQRIRSDTCSRP